MADENQNQDESSVIRDLRKQLKEKDDRLTKLEPLARKSVFEEAGIDLDDPRSKFFVDNYDGDLEVESIREKAEPYGYIKSEDSAEQEQSTEGDAQQQRMDGLRQQSSPEGAGKRINHQEWMELSKADPRAAQDAFTNGLVDLPPHIAQSVQASS